MFIANIFIFILCLNLAFPLSKQFWLLLVICFGQVVFLRLAHSFALDIFETIPYRVILEANVIDVKDAFPLPIPDCLLVPKSCFWLLGNLLSFIIISLVCSVLSHLLRGHTFFVSHFGRQLLYSLRLLFGNLGLVSGQWLDQLLVAEAVLSRLLGSKGSDWSDG